MTKAELIESIYKRQDNLLPEKEVSDAVNTILAEMIDELGQGERSEFRGFGSFKLNFWGERHARNPENGQTWRTKPRYAVHFKPGSALRDAVNVSFEKSVHIESSIDSENTHGENQNSEQFKPQEPVGA